MVDFKKELYQTIAIRKEVDKPQTSMTWTPDAKRIFKEIKRKLKEHFPGIRNDINKSVILETFIRMCRTILLENEMKEDEMEGASK